MTETTSTRLSIPPADQLQVIESIVIECGMLAHDRASHFAHAIKMAAGIKALRGLLTDEFMKQYVMPLQGSKLGFRTDKDREGGYPIPTVRDCAIECLLRGGNLNGNEFNIIAGNCYFTKEFFERRVGELEGVSDIQLLEGVPQSHGSGALVPYLATWNINGKKQQLQCVERDVDGVKVDTRIPVRVNQGMGVDAILGKAKRKILVRIFNRVTGSNAWEGEADDVVEALPAPTRSLDALKDKLQAGNETAKENGGKAENGPNRRLLASLALELGCPEDAVNHWVTIAATKGDEAGEYLESEPWAPQEAPAREPGDEDTGGGWDDLYNTLDSQLSEATGLQAVESIRKRTRGGPEDEALPADVQKVVDDMCDARRKEIVDARPKK